MAAAVPARVPRPGPGAARAARALMLLLPALLCACATPGPRGERWPVDLPPRSVFERAWEADAANRSLQSRKDYLKWIRRFYQGWSVAPQGWTATTQAMLEGVPPRRYLLMRAKLDYLGQLIAAEWAKHGEVRRIDSRLLMLWGRVARTAVEGGRRADAVDRVIADVEAVLADELAPAAIDEQRYQAFLGREPDPFAELISEG